MKEGIIMGLIKCEDCGKLISDAAESCPNCGRPIKNAPIYSPLPQCPHCGKVVAEITERCPECGTVLKEQLNENQILQDIHLRSMCPICGNDKIMLAPTKDSIRIVEGKDGVNCVEYLCNECGSWVSPYKPQQHFIYYSRCSGLLGVAPIDVMLAEVKTNPLFDEEECEKRLAGKEKYSGYHSNIYNSPKPKCPTCGSTNIEKISTASKVVGASLFGLFSNTARSQYKCKNCGYKW